MPLPTSAPCISAKCNTTTHRHRRRRHRRHRRQHRPADASTRLGRGGGHGDRLRLLCTHAESSFSQWERPSLHANHLNGGPPAETEFAISTYPTSTHSNAAKHSYPSNGADAFPRHADVFGLGPQHDLHQPQFSRTASPNQTPVSVHPGSLGPTLSPPMSPGMSPRQSLTHGLTRAGITAKTMGIGGNGMAAHVTLELSLTDL